jgi:hydrogenase/urease accessory protein HupE
VENMKKDPLKIQSHVILGFLILQYLLGMAANLFVQFPDTSNVKKLWQYAQGQWTVVVHMILGFLLLVGSIILLFRAIRRKDKNWIFAGSIGLFAILSAVVAGSEFIPTQQDVYSYIMAASFIIAVLAYGWGIYKAKK